MRIRLIISGLIIVFVSLGYQSSSNDCTNSTYLLEQTIMQYDALGHWINSELKIHIQEPRIGNPERYTKLIINNRADHFEMERKKDIGVIKRIITKNNESQIFVNGSTEVSQEIQEKYALNLARTQISKKFYRAMYGVPMSLTDSFWKSIEPARKAYFEGKEVYRISMELEEALISKFWTIIIGCKSKEILAIEFNHPEDPAKAEEIIKFSGFYEVAGMAIPRVRNWFIKGTNEYLGTDVIVEELN